MKLAVVVCGRIGSGKSTAVNFITAEFGFKAVSFGSYIRHMAALRGTPSTRSQLQDLGDCVFRCKGPSGFLKGALKYFGISRHDSVVFDGVRHLEILTAIKQAAEATIAVYLEVNQDERFRRHRDRQASGWSLEEFLIVDSHPVEAGLDMIIDHCDLVVNAECSSTIVQEVLRDRIVRNGVDRIATVTGADASMEAAGRDTNGCQGPLFIPKN